MPTIHQVAEGVQHVADTTARIADASQHMAVVASATDEALRASRSLVKLFIVALVTVAIAGTIGKMLRRRSSADPPEPAG